MNRHRRLRGVLCFRGLQTDRRSSQTATTPQPSTTAQKPPETKWTTVETPFGKLQVPQTPQQQTLGEGGQAYRWQPYHIPAPIHTVPDPVGQPGFGESFIPVWGNLRASADYLQRGNARAGVFYGAMAIGDIFVVKDLAIGAARLGARLLFREAVEHVEAQAAQRTVRGVAHAGLRESQHFIDLGTDAAHSGEFAPRQAVGGRAIEEHLGRELQPGTHEGIDFVDTKIKDISLKGPLPERGDLAGFVESAIEDIHQNTATQTLFVDLQGLSVERAAEAERLIRAGATGGTKVVIFLR